MTGHWHLARDHRQEDVEPPIDSEVGRLGVLPCEDPCEAWLDGRDDLSSPRGNAKATLATVSSDGVRKPAPEGREPCIGQSFTARSASLSPDGVQEAN